MLTLFADGAESLWDELLPEEVRVLPGDLARLDELLCDPELLVPIAMRWERELAETSRFWRSGAAVAGDGDLRAVDGAQAPVRVGVRDKLMREVSDSDSICGGSAGWGSPSGCRTSRPCAS